MFVSEWREFPSAPCLAGEEIWWQLAFRCCWNRARPWRASELVSFLVVGLRTYQHPVNCHFVLLFLFYTFCLLCVHDTYCDILTFSATSRRIVFYSAFRFLGTNMCLQMESKRQPEVASLCKIPKQLYVLSFTLWTSPLSDIPKHLAAVVSFPLNMVVFRSAVDCISHWVAEWQSGGEADTLLHLRSDSSILFLRNDCM